MCRQHSVLFVVFVGIVILGARLDAIVIYGVKSEHDDLTTRENLQDFASDIAEAREIAAQIEHFVILDESKLVDRKVSPAKPTLSRTEVEKRLGAPIEFVEKSHARPWSAPWIVQVDGLTEDDLRPERGRVQFYAIQGVGGLRVIYNKENIALSPAMLFLKTDKEFVPLKSSSDFSQRLAWELPKLRALKTELIAEHLRVIESERRSPFNLQLQK